MTVSAAHTTGHIDEALSRLDDALTELPYKPHEPDGPLLGVAGDGDEPQGQGAARRPDRRAAHRMGTPRNDGRTVPRLLRHPARGTSTICGRPPNRSTCCSCP
ncbi:hypothetical protein ACFQ60_02185 [Streptomyces zhihengii]